MSSAKSNKGKKRVITYFLTFVLSEIPHAGKQLQLHCPVHYIERIDNMFQSGHNPGRKGSLRLRFSSPTETFCLHINFLLLYISSKGGKRKRGKLHVLLSKGYADDSDGHDNGKKNMGKGHPYTAHQNPDNIHKG